MSSESDVPTQFEPEPPESDRQKARSGLESPASPGSPGTPGRASSHRSAGHGGSWLPSEIPDARFSPGTILADRYRIVATLGKGGMGEVYRADDLKLGQPVALKFLPQELTHHPDRLRRFHNEVRIARQVSHPNVCRVYDIGEIEGLHYLSMEYIDGEDLGSLLRRIGRLSTDKALENARQICAGLGAAHERGILHRDLKPANIMIDGRGIARIADFGLAALGEEIEGAEIRAGTPGYMAPEQLEGTAVTVQSDLYSLGLVLYEMFTGKRVFEGMTIDQIRDAQRDSRLTPPSDVRPGIDPVVERAILRCLSAEPTERPISAYQVAASFPGGDPLAAALAAGEVPSPELVAASGDEGTLRPAVAIAALIAFFMGLLALGFLHDRHDLAQRSGLEKPPAVLQERSREILGNLGYTQRPVDSAWGMSQHNDFLRWIAANDSSATRWDNLDERRPGAISFWYRESQQYLVPNNLVAQVTSRDPSLTVEGMNLVGVDPDGRLVRLFVIPPEADSTRIRPAGRAADAATTTALVDSIEVPGAATPGVDPQQWEIVLRDAGLDPALLRETQPIWNPPLFVEQRRAWIGTYPEEPEIEIRVEAGAYSGRVNYFEIFHPWSRPTLSHDRENRGIDGAQLVVNLFIVGILIGAIYLARRNMALGRGDRRGALRLAGVISVLFTTSLLIDAHHVPKFQPEWNLFSIATGIGLFLGGFLYVLYQALEPYVRRMWPRVLISWSRVLTGRWRSARVGRDFLFGATVSVAVNLMHPLYQEIRLGRGEAIAIPKSFSFDAFHGLDETFLVLAQSLVNTIWVPLSLLAFVLLLRFLIRHDLGAILGGYVLITTLMVLSTNDWFARGGTIIYMSAMWFVLFRIGVVGAAGFFLIYFAVENLPLGLNFSAWWGGSTALIMVFLGGCAATAFRISLGSNWLTQSDLIPDERPRTLTRQTR